MADHSGSWWVWGKANSVYVSNSGGNKTTVVFDNSNGQEIYEGDTPPSDATNFTITSVTMYLKGTEYATSSYTLKAWLGDSTGGTYAGETGEAHGSNTNGNSGSSYSYELALSGGSIGLSTIRSPSNKFCIQVGTAAKTGNKILFKTSYDSSWIWVKYTWDDAAPSYTACGAPTSVTLSRNRGTVTIGWSGATAGTNNAIASYTIIRNTSASESGATTTHTGVTSGGQTNAPGTGTFYYGVKTVGSVSGYDSGYKWSSSITVPARPTVSQGDYITKAQMDTLRTFINTGCTEVTRYAKIDDAQGDTYSPAPENDKITAYWYNNA